MSKLLLLPALSWPTLLLAQSAPASHGYLGLGASGLNASLFQQSGHYYVAPTAVGPALTAGWQFSSRLAVQLSPAVQWGRRTERYSSYPAVGGQSLRTLTYRISSTQLLVPLQARVTLTGPAARLRVDVLAGAAWLHSDDTFTHTTTDDNSGEVVARQVFPATDNLVLLTLGPAVRYELKPGLALALALPVHYNLRQLYDYFYTPVFSDHLLLQPQLSAYYALGSR